MDPIPQMIAGFLLGFTVSLFAWKLGALTLDGSISAAFVGTLIFGLGGFNWAIVLLVFFTSSSVLSRMFTRRKFATDEKFSKGAQRDWEQVMANAGLATILVIIQAMIPNQHWPWLAYVGAMAAVNADTWATEIGVLSQTPPRLIINGQVVERGTSGGISLMGLNASLGGALLVGGFGLIFLERAELITIPERLLFLFVVSLAGFAGSIFDSFLGATFQAMYYCPTCQKETEHYPRHSCGSDTQQIRGLKWLNNDTVNAAASTVGAGFAVVGGWILL